MWKKVGVVVIAISGKVVMRKYGNIHIRKSVNAVANVILRSKAT